MLRREGRARLCWYDGTDKPLSHEVSLPMKKFACQVRRKKEKEMQANKQVGKGSEGSQSEGSQAEKKQSFQ